jgi:hypothetical protein
LGERESKESEQHEMNTPIEYILVGIVTLAIIVYLVIALLAPEKF